MVGAILVVMKAWMRVSAGNKNSDGPRCAMFLGGRGQFS